ncbi:MAG TPA: polysaccharide deacetylase family protein [Bacilli bacterium]|nr:polysaccharide deacetylase family protein [Bacilli bacterium]
MRKFLSICLLSFALLLISGCGGKSDEPKVTVLMYHHFADGERNSVIVNPEQFHEQLSALKEAGYSTITERQLLAFLNEEEVELPEKPLLITIDDGYLSNYEVAYPTLKELGMNAVIYVVSSSRGQTPGYIEHFTWEQAKEMYESGVIDIQSHTHDQHAYVESAKGEKPALSVKLIVDGVEESDEEYRERIYNDLKTSKEEIEANVGNEVFSLTYPYGAFNDTVIEVATELGYRLMYTVKEGVTYAGSDSAKINRINVDGNYTIEELLKKIEQY